MNQGGIIVIWITYFMKLDSYKILCRPRKCLKLDSLLVATRPEDLRPSCWRNNLFLHKIDLSLLAAVDHHYCSTLISASLLSEPFGFETTLSLSSVIAIIIRESFQPWRSAQWYRLKKAEKEDLSVISELNPASPIRHPPSFRKHQQPTL
jgi:hypothetical protein